MSRWFLVTLALVLCSCGSDKTPENLQKAARPEPVIPTAENKTNALAKYIEFAGFRMSERSGGKLAVRFVVINHSQADIADLGLDVTTMPCTVSVKVPSLGPEETKDVTGECVTKMRVYELPDWQFIRPTFKITSPVQ
jgi:hypothetical protein